MNTMLSSSSITGTGVTNMEGQDLGNIKDLMINTENGEIEYAVLAFGGLMGIGDKYFAIPWKSFSVNTTDESMTLDLSKDQLGRSPGFDKDSWPSSRTDKYLIDVNNYFRAYA